MKQKNEPRMANSKTTHGNSRLPKDLTIRFAVRSAFGMGFFLSIAGCGDCFTDRKCAVDMSGPPASDCPDVAIGKGVFRADVEKYTLFLAVPDIQGTYAIPYIQSGRNLEVKNRG